MYLYITNPKDNKKYDVRTKKGKNILKNYINQLGGKKHPCQRFRKFKAPKCEDNDECMWIKKQGCYPKKTMINSKKGKKKTIQKQTAKKVDIIKSIWDSGPGAKLLSMGNFGPMSTIKDYRHKLKRLVTKSILDKFINSKTYHKGINEYLKNLMDDEIILGSRPDFAKRPYINPNICNSFKKTKDPKCDDQELCEWGDKGKWQGVGCKISEKKFAKRNETLPWYEGWRDDTTDVLTKSYNRSYYTSMDKDIIPPWQKNYNAARWKRNKGYDVWNWGHLLYNNKISGLSAEFKSGKKSTQNTYKKLYKDLEKYIYKKKHQIYYFNKTDLVVKLKKLVNDGLKDCGWDEVRYEPIPFKFAETNEGKPFTNSSNPDNLDTWIKYKLSKGHIALVVWGSGKAFPIQEKYVY